jgi:hypothetical protein
MSLNSVSSSHSVIPASSRSPVQFFKDHDRFINVNAVKFITSENGGKTVILDMLDGSQITIANEQDAKAILDAVENGLVKLERR